MVDPLHCKNQVDFWHTLVKVKPGQFVSPIRHECQRSKKFNSIQAINMKLKSEAIDPKWKKTRLFLTIILIGALHAINFSNNSLQYWFTECKTSQQTIYPYRNLDVAQIDVLVVAVVVVGHPEDHVVLESAWNRKVEPEQLRDVVVDRVHRTNERLHRGVPDRHRWLWDKNVNQCLLSNKLCSCFYDPNIPKYIISSDW